MFKTGKEKREAKGGRRRRRRTRVTFRRHEKMIMVIATIATRQRLFKRSTSSPRGGRKWIKLLTRTSSGGEIPRSVAARQFEHTCVSFTRVEKPVRWRGCWQFHARSIWVSHLIDKKMQVIIKSVLGEAFKNVARVYSRYGGKLREWLLVSSEIYFSYEVTCWQMRFWVSLELLCLEEIVIFRCLICRIRYFLFIRL